MVRARRDYIQGVLRIFHLGQEEPPHKGRATGDCNIQCKNITKRLTRAKTGRRTERKQHEMGCDRARRSPKKRGKFQNCPKWPLAVPLCGPQLTSRCRFSRKQEMERQITRVSSGSSRVAELVLRITDRYKLKIVQVYAPTYMRQQHINQMKRQTTSTTPLIRSWKSKHITQ